MPVTPVFTIDQDEEFVKVDIRVPYVRVSDLEYEVNGNEVSFFCKPYLLKLGLPAKVVDDDRCKAVYDVNRDNGTVTLHLPKQEKGLHFPDLDLLTKLRQPKGKTGQAATGVNWLKQEEQALNAMGVARPASSASPLIEVISSVDFEEEEEDQPKQGQEQAHEQQEEELVKLFEKTNFLEVGEDKKDEAEVQVLVSAPEYGFNNAMTGFFTNIMNDFPELVDLPDPDHASVKTRRKLRREVEDDQFNVERYVGDFFLASEDVIYIESMNFEPMWRKGNSFTEEEQEQMRQLTNREFLRFSPEELRRALCAIFDVLVAFAYDHRTTQGDATVESPWTIRILSSTLSWLDEFQDPKQVMKASLHRMLTYPYLRHLGLSTMILKDAAEILEKGKRAILKSLLTVHRLFAKSETYYLLNRLYITDMCIWIQQVSDNIISHFADLVSKQVHEIEPYKLIRWDLKKFEQSYPDGEGQNEDGDGDSDGSSTSSSEDDDSDSDETSSGSSSSSSDDTDGEEEIQQEETQTSPEQSS